MEIYGATKAALRNFARSWTLNTQANGFRPNVISAGAIRTPGLLGIVPEYRQGGLAMVEGVLPAGRLDDPDEVAAKRPAPLTAPPTSTALN